MGGESPEDWCRKNLFLAMVLTLFYGLPRLAIDSARKKVRRGK